MQGPVLYTVGKVQWPEWAVNRQCGSLGVERVHGSALSVAAEANGPETREKREAGPTAHAISETSHDT